MNRYGLFVGINRYNNGITPLSYARSDASSLYRTFLQEGYDLDLMIDDEVSQANVITKLRRKNFRSGDVFVFYFSGHGCEINGNHCLVSSTAHASLLHYQVGLIPVSLICELTNTPGLRRLFILDSCRNDLYANHKGISTCSPDRERALKQLAEEQNEDNVIPPLILTSCGTGEVSFESPEEGQGVFTSALLDVVHDRNINSFAQFQRALSTAVNEKIAQLVPGRHQTVSWNGDVFQDIPLFERWQNANRSHARPEPVKQELPEEVDESQTLNIVLLDNTKLEMVQIKAGSFTMGSPEDELGRNMGETLHQVTLTQDYWLGKFPVTQAQFELIMGKNPSHFKGANLPVENVSWHDAKKFCDKLNELYSDVLKSNGCRFDLPTEAQWEYACRAGTTTALNNGANLLSEDRKCFYLNEVGWYDENSGKNIHPVGQKRPNAWGLYDMHGNVKEWCRDWYADYNGDATNPTGPSTGSTRIYRGGSWDNFARYCRSASRSSSLPHRGYGDVGFRIALVPAGKTENFRHNKQETCRTEEPEYVKLPLSADEDIVLEMVQIKAGTFMMGSPEGELGRSDTEKQHQVTLTQDYLLGKFPVTQAQYELIMGENPSDFKGANRPVENVTWEDAKKFCAKLNDLYSGKLPAGYRFDLPTEAQWEYACRAGTTTALNNGKNLTDGKYNCKNLAEVAWYDYKNEEYETHPVGQKRPNAWGLYDMHGNVCEWCRDLVTGPRDGEAYHVYRGGSWLDNAEYCRSATRIIEEDSYCDNDTGFRLALVPVK